MAGNGATPERVVLLTPDRTPIGVQLKSEVHSDHTPLHLAFSCYVTNSVDEVLVTRRALSKCTWPGVWTNTCCGHPNPGEDMSAAVRRRLVDELGLEVGEVTGVLPDFAYTATDASGIVENEICPVFTADLPHPDSVIVPNPDEVMDYTWVTWDALATSARSTPFAFSPWSVLQLSQLSPTRRRVG